MRQPGKPYNVFKCIDMGQRSLMVYVEEVTPIAAGILKVSLLSVKVGSPGKVFVTSLYHPPGDGTPCRHEYLPSPVLPWDAAMGSSRGAFGGGGCGLPPGAAFSARLWGNDGAVP
jgi:hypothetical protein